MNSENFVAANGEQRIIKKYPNRRLYDTITSSYITLSEVRQLVMTRQPFEVAWHVKRMAVRRPKVG